MVFGGVEVWERRRVEWEWRPWAGVGDEVPLLLVLELTLRPSLINFLILSSGLACGLAGHLHHLYVMQG